MRPVTPPLALIAHPASPQVPVLITVECRLEPRELVLHYRLRPLLDARVAQSVDMTSALAHD